MKKTLSLLLSLILSLGVLAGCSFGGDDEPDEEKREVITITAAEVEAKECFVTIEEEAQRLLPNATGSDGRYNYFYVKLGSVRRTPIYYENAYSHLGMVDREYEWSETESYERAIETATEKCIEQTVSRELTLGASSSLEIEAGFEYAGLEIGAKATASTNLESSLGHSTTDSVTKSTSKTVSQKVEKTKRNAYKITKDCPEGVYRYTVYATVDVYAALVCDIQTETYTYTYFSVIDQSTLMEELSYFEDESFGVKSERTLSLDVSVLDGVDLYADDLPLVKKTVLYKNNQRKTVTDDGLYGSEQQSTQEVLDLSALEHYMSEAFEFTFAITVNIEEKNDGYQELFLYNQEPSYDSKSENWSHAMAVLNGLVAESGKIDSGSKAYNKTLTFTVSGEKCAKTMYIRYDAQGEKEDTWYRNNIEISISASRK